MLRQDVERVFRDLERFDLARKYPLSHDGGLEQVASKLWKDDAEARLANTVAGAADPLEPACYRTWRFDEHDEVDRAHIDTELERARRH